VQSHRSRCFTTPSTLLAGSGYPPLDRYQECAGRTLRLMYLLNTADSGKHPSQCNSPAEGLVLMKRTLQTLNSQVPFLFQHRSMSMPHFKACSPCSLLFFIWILYFLQMLPFSANATSAESEKDRLSPEAAGMCVGVPRALKWQPFSQR